LEQDVDAISRSISKFLTNEFASLAAKEHFRSSSAFSDTLFQCDRYRGTLRRRPTLENYDGGCKTAITCVLKINLNRTLPLYAALDRATPKAWTQLLESHDVLFQTEVTITSGLPTAILVF
jgi:hypothetical protein